MFLRTLIWALLAIALVRGLWVFDSGRSATFEMVGAGVCFGAAVLGTVLMFCLDIRRN
jgi:hypothetical protein